MLAGVNVKRIIVTIVIVVLTVATMFAVFILAFGYISGWYLKKTLAEFPDLVGAEVLRADDPPESQVHPVADPEFKPAGPSNEGSESNAPSKSPPKVYPNTETQGDDARGREVNSSRTHLSSE